MTKLQLSLSLSLSLSLFFRVLKTYLRNITRMPRQWFRHWKPRACWCTDWSFPTKSKNNITKAEQHIFWGGQKLSASARVPIGGHLFQRTGITSRSALKLNNDKFTRSENFLKTTCHQTKYRKPPTTEMGRPWKKHHFDKFNSSVRAIKASEQRTKMVRFLWSTY